ncbi:Uracil DNA glycosylase superfamily protein [Sulfitobacter sp. THAF37]|uniref:UdgX family uracil-DNA binding protein n=1 Tax=Sulfitobacter sp. THAF37 TaxID=2587855 RepID=UPI0012A9D8A5|nr:UdgX family uracil-DNA binding protein [Sulfitobacter sp. THAF37]QFT57729.1 Uracil DNA glycosylase superfamily protein [Sulfitobacter sp. THAF37]
MSHVVRLPRLGTFDAWRTAARALASNGVPAERVIWTMEDTAPGLFEETACPLPAPKPITVPKAFPPLAKLLCASRADGAVDLAYRLLLRCQDTPRLLTNRADAQVARAEELGKNIRRDMHKMKAFVRFRDVTPKGANRRKFLSWFEPDHRIEELMTGFFARRFGDMDWIIVTPEVTMRFDGEVSLQAVASDRPDLSDDMETLWQTYYANIFNPARLKIKAMTAEMPRKYWKNLPEADLIPGLIAKAEARARGMAEAAPTLPPDRAAAITDRLRQGLAPPPDGTTLGGCTRCPLAQHATQAVPGEGPRDAALMIVGEQPGDMEDLSGRPFVGPAGQAFDRIAAEAGLDRRAAYVTNAVKHFKFTPRGKRRIHQSPNADEVSHCRWWLARELETVQPALVLALGATAASALTGDGANITRRRGSIERGLHGGPVFITTHPAFLLRQSTDLGRESQEALYRRDLEQVAQMMAQVVRSHDVEA